MNTFESDADQVARIKRMMHLTGEFKIFVTRGSRVNYAIKNLNNTKAIKYKMAA